MTTVKAGSDSEKLKDAIAAVSLSALDLQELPGLSPESRAKVDEIRDLIREIEEDTFV